MNGKIHDLRRSGERRLCDGSTWATELYQRRSILMHKRIDRRLKAKECRFRRAHGTIGKRALTRRQAGRRRARAPGESDAGSGKKIDVQRSHRIGSDITRERVALSLDRARHRQGRANDKRDENETAFHNGVPLQRLGGTRCFPESSQVSLFRAQCG